MRKQGKQPRKLYPGFSYTRIQDAESKEQTISVYRLSFEQEGAVLISIKEDDKDDIKSRIEKLLLDANLSNLISQYIELKKRLDTNRNRNEFFDKIDGLYKKIYLEGESLDRKGKCILCPQEPL